MGMTAIACLCLGIFPTAMIRWMDVIAAGLSGELSESAGAFGWIWLTPIPMKGHPTQDRLFYLDSWVLCP